MDRESIRALCKRLGMRFMEEEEPDHPVWTEGYNVFFINGPVPHSAEKRPSRKDLELDTQEIDQKEKPGSDQ